MDFIGDFIGVFFDPEYGGGWFPGLMVLILSGYVAAPAVATMALVALERWWPLFRRSAIAAGLAAIALTFVAGAAWIGAVAGVADEYGQHKTLYRALPYLALGTAAIAAWVQVRHRATFTRARGVGIACAVLAPVVVFVAQVSDI